MSDTGACCSKTHLIIFFVYIIAILVIFNTKVLQSSSQMIHRNKTPSMLIIFIIAMMIKKECSTKTLQITTPLQNWSRRWSAETKTPLECLRLTNHCCRKKKSGNTSISICLFPKFLQINRDISHWKTNLSISNVSDTFLLWVNKCSINTGGCGE